MLGDLIQPHSSVIPLGDCEPEIQATSLLHDIVISQELAVRPLRKFNRPGEIAGMYSLASVFPHGPVAVLKQLAKLAVELCSAGSSGVSVIEGDQEAQVFRWQALAGELEEYEGGTSPRDWSPCGECLKAGKAMLYSYPARYFTYFQELNTPIVEGLVIPMYVDSVAVGTIWIVTHDRQCRFDAEDVRIMTSLGAFAAGVLRRAIGTPASRKNNAGSQERGIVWEEYVRRIGRGDEFALAALMDETGPHVFAVVRRILNFRQDTEEVVEDVYAQVWRAAATYEVQRGKVAAWLTTIARNRAIDRLRSRGLVQSEIALSESLSFLSTAEVESAAAAFEAKDHISEALQTLPFEHRRAIELAYFSGFSMSEIAKRLGHPLGTVKTHIRNGLTMLRSHLGSRNRSPFPSS